LAAVREKVKWRGDFQQVRSPRCARCTHRHQLQPQFSDSGWLRTGGFRGRNWRSGHSRCNLEPWPNPTDPSHSTLGGCRSAT